MHIDYQLEKMVKSALDKEELAVLIAVSTGVDSMVLLDLLRNYAKNKQGKLVVAHVNHQLRSQSEEEEIFLRTYCEESNLPFYSKKWVPTKTGIEANARKFRYQFFQEIMEKEKLSFLVTAHHNDDQIETILMKIIREGQLNALKGIVRKQPFGDNGYLIRPLLGASKKMMYAYAEKKKVLFFEDETNQQTIYLRNRLRQRIVPLLKQENSQTGLHFQQIADQIQMKENLLEELVWENDQKQINRLNEGWQVSMSYLESISDNHLNYFLEEFSSMLNKQKINVTMRQRQQVFSLIKKCTPQWQIQLEKKWMICRSYEFLYVKKNQKNLADFPIETIQLSIGQSMYLSDSQWIGLFRTDQSHFPVEIADWQTYSVEIGETTPFPLHIRKRMPGDRLKLTNQLNKKISRWLIDQKIPNYERDSGWFVSDFHKKGIVFLPFVHSCLSIDSETDKIRYVLLYKYRK